MKVVIKPLVLHQLEIAPPVDSRQLTFEDYQPMEGEGRLQIASSDHHYNHCHHIKEDVLIEILLRLLVKSPLRFKCVCKHCVDYHDIDHLHMSVESSVALEGPINGLFCLFMIWNA
ncbi:hypothetical protein RHMOL_Rhmol08G0258800 [Rhododendron molle]|uniref:Uncharacterized protein n=1 Tax=Rhododendron molle TaxID=49168 RepID=A0ACC0MST5_RHOML|nr:hypothetical protein RHMOL_Rhmol08G0258800 [Rhododendron molle]